MKIDPQKDFGTRECPSCATEVPANNNRCPICNYEFPAQRSTRGLIIIAAILILILIWFLIRQHP